MHCPYGLVGVAVAGKAASSPSRKAFLVNHRTPKEGDRLPSKLGVNRRRPLHSQRHGSEDPPRQSKALRMWVLGVPGGVVLEVAGGLDYGEVVAGAGYEL